MARALEAIDGGDATVAELAVMAALSGLDRAVQKGVLHRNNASRRKSRLAIKMNHLLEAAPEAAPEPARGRQTRRRATGSRRG